MDDDFKMPGATPVKIKASARRFIRTPQSFSNATPTKRSLTKARSKAKFYKSTLAQTAIKSTMPFIDEFKLSSLSSSAAHAASVYEASQKKLSKKASSFSARLSEAVELERQRQGMVPKQAQNLKMDRNIQTAPAAPDHLLTHCERMVRRGKQNLLIKVNQQQTVISDQQNLIDGQQTLIADLKQQLLQSHAVKDEDVNPVKEPASAPSIIALIDRSIAFLDSAETQLEIQPAEEGVDVMDLLISQFDADTVSQAMWLRYLSAASSSSSQATGATAQVKQAVKVLTLVDGVEHTAYDLLMQFIAFDAVMPSQSVRNSILLELSNKTYTQKEAADIACFDRFVGKFE